MFFNFCSLHSDFIQKPQAVVVSAKQLVALFEDAINVQQPNTLGGSTESLKSYYKMIQQFAATAHTYRDLIPDQYDASSIFELIDFILDLKLEEFQKIANTLSSADKEIEILKTQLATMKLQKQGLMQELLTGKRRVKLN